MNIFVKFKGKRISAGILKDNVFEKKVKRRDRLWKFGGGGAYGLDVAYIEQLDCLGCGTIRLLEDSGDIYEASLEKVKTKGIKAKIGGFGERYYLVLDGWSRKEKKALPAAVTAAC